LAAGSATEVLARPVRRKFTQEYKRRIIRDAAAAKKPGDIAALLRREGLYSSHLSSWREQEKASDLKPRKPGPKPTPPNPLAKRVAELERENRKLRRQFEKAQLVIEFQKKISDVLGIPLKDSESDENDS
jgi:transposase-like protein